MKKRNGFISLWKFIFCIAIALYHVAYFNESGDVSLFKAGYIFTEFFFIVSGYFMAQKCYAQSYDPDRIGAETIRFIFGKIKSFFPYILLAHIAGMIVHIHFDGIGIYQIVISVWNLLFLQNTGFTTYWSANVPVWYLSAMLLSMWIIFPLLRKNADRYALIFAPLSAVLMLGYLSQNYPSLNLSTTFDGWVHAGVIRAFAELNLGIAAFRLSQHLGRIAFSRLGKITLSLIAVICLAAPLYISTFIAKPMKYDQIIVLLFFVAVSVSCSGHCFDSKLWNNKAVFYLERLSLPVYVNHYFIRLLFQHLVNPAVSGYYWRIAGYLLSVVAISAMELMLFDSLRRHPIPNPFVLNKES